MSVLGSSLPPLALALSLDGSIQKEKDKEENLKPEELINHSSFNYIEILPRKIARLIGTLMVDPQDYKNEHLYQLDRFFITWAIYPLIESRGLIEEDNYDPKYYNFKYLIEKINAINAFPLHQILTKKQIQAYLSLYLELIRRTFFQLILLSVRLLG